MTDVLLYESGNGGEMKLNSNDLATVNGYENACYLAMFGGDNTFWGNYLMLANQYNSKTEAALNTTALNSGGRITIEEAINEDLSFLNNIDGTTWTVATAIEGPKRLRITITINGEVFNYLWTPDKLYLNYLV